MDRGLVDLRHSVSSCWVNVNRYCKQSQEGREFRQKLRTHTCSTGLCLQLQGLSLFYWSIPQTTTHRTHLTWRGAQIDMWTAYYKSTSLKLNCAKSIGVQIPCWPSLILIINLLTRTRSYSRHNGGPTYEKVKEDRGNEFSFVPAYV